MRLLAATHRDLTAEVKAGRFREDLLYRLKVVHLHVPALRERPEDIAVLARHFFARASRSFGVPAIAPTPAHLERLVAWPWPGNVRELENVIEGAIALSADGTVDLAMLPSEVSSAEPAHAADGREDRLDR